jgi:hypothetical protein
MARLTSDYQAYLPRLSGHGGWGRSSLSPRSESSGASRNMLIAGLLVIGVGALAFYVLGPDVKRYMKMRDM